MHPWTEVSEGFPPEPTRVNSCIICLRTDHKADSNRLSEGKMAVRNRIEISTMLATSFLFFHE